MRRLIVLLAGLLIALVLLTWGALAAVHSATRAWFDADLSSGAELAANAARPALLDAWESGSSPQLDRLLADMTRDERVLAVALCGLASDTPVSRTPAFPESLSCDTIQPAEHRETAGGWQTSGRRVSLPSGDVHVTAVPLRRAGQVSSFLSIVHDVSYMTERESATRRFLFVACGVLAFMTSIVTIAAGRVPWRHWTSEFRRALSDGSDHPEFRFVMHDVRVLAEQIAAERDLDRDVETWTPARLRETLVRHLDRDQILVVSNREPYIHQRDGDHVRVLRPASGLVTALEPVMRACSGVWIAHGSGTADRQTVDGRGRLSVPPGENAYTLRRVWLTADVEKGYYYGFANEGLWPLCHIAHTRPTFRTEDWRAYQAANREFANAVADEATTASPIVLVQDYHFGVLPRYIRERLPKATILTFWHIPWPNSERFGICPQREELLDGMLGADILGFHTQADCNNFIDTVDRYLEARTDREQQALIQRGHRSFVRPYPISIGWPPPVQDVPNPAEARATVVRDLDLAPETRIGVGIDRLDYTKGIEERLLAVERLLERFPEHRGRFTFVQLAAPSRTAIARYAQLNRDVEEIAARVNQRFGDARYRPIVLKREHFEPPTVYRYYRAADLCYVSSLHDGMNLVAKEFVAARDDDDGVLVLSQFTGAARELTEALIVNPYDLDQASDALATALQMPERERRTRMRHMRTLVSEFNVYRWAGRMLLDAARLRRNERLPSRHGAMGGLA